MEAGSWIMMMEFRKSKKKSIFYLQDLSSIF